MNSENIGSAAGATGGTADNVGGEARDATKQASMAASDLYGRAEESVRTVADDASSSDVVATGQRIYDRGSAELSRRVAKQPLEALLLAGALGYLVGWAANRG